MAEPIPVDKLSLSSEQQDSDRLMKYLEEKYNMPPHHGEWWDEVDIAFQWLRNILERGPNETSNEEDDPLGITPQSARADALPLVSLLPSGSHALRLTATNEDLPCVAFGTISTELYVDIFWEAVARIQDGGGKFVVYRVDSDRFWFNFEGHDFDLLYVHCEELIRSCPRILKVSDEYLQEADAHTQKVVEGIRRDTKKRAWFSKRHQKASYYYLRAWAIAQGRYTSNEQLFSARTFRFQQLIKIMDLKELLDIKTERAVLRPKPKNQENPVLSMAYQISEIFENLNEKVLSRPPCPQPFRGIAPDLGAAELLRLLEEAEAGLVHSKFQMPLYIQVNLTYWGGSELACGKWLSIVERRLSKLKERLETTDPQPGVVCIWPQRLLERDSQNSQRGFWSGCYILGLRHYNDLQSNRRIANAWNSQTEQDTDTPKDDCSIETAYLTADEFDDKNLIPCPRRWPRPVLTVDWEKKRLAKQGDGRDQAKKTEKQQRSSEQASNVEVNNNKSHRRLRTARAVLNRLKYDPNFNIDEYKVGYEDRHTDEIQEKPVATWVRETTDELFIPEHRIVWFKRCAANGGVELVWDRASKIDRIFTDSGAVEGTV